MRLTRLMLASLCKHVVLNWLSITNSLQNVLRPPAGAAEPEATPWPAHHRSVTAVVALENHGKTYRRGTERHHHHTIWIFCCIAIDAKPKVSGSQAFCSNDESPKSEAASLKKVSRSAPSTRTLSSSNTTVAPLSYSSPLPTPSPPTVEGSCFDVSSCETEKASTLEGRGVTHGCVFE